MMDGSHEKWKQHWLMQICQCDVGMWDPLWIRIFCPSMTGSWILIFMWARLNVWFHYVLGSMHSIVFLILLFSVGLVFEFEWWSHGSAPVVVPRDRPRDLLTTTNFATEWAPLWLIYLWLSGPHKICGCEEATGGDPMVLPRARSRVISPLSTMW